MEDHTQDQEINVNPTDQPPGTGVSLSLTEIEVLRDRIEQQKANKLKAEQLVSTLSRIKAREKATRRSVKPGEKKIDEGIPNQPTKRSGTNSSNALKEKSNLLKKKLEEDRAKFESKKGQEDLGKVSQIVEHIRVQLEDQDKTIQQIHSNFASSRTPAHVPEVLPAEPDIPDEVKQKIAELEMKVLDLQENLREKDSVISARTQAITLLSEDMARKGKHTLDTLEETRTQMQTMQANFAALEDRMNEERIRLREELDAKKIRLQQLDKNYRAAESARFDLSTRVAELQEKVVALQTKNLTLEEELKENETKVKELKEALENSNKQAIKMKAQFKSKLKAVEEERDMLRKEEQTNEELIRLRERVAELEDEKEAGNILKERIAEMEEKLQRQELDLDSHVKAITSLEAEKLDLIEATNKKNAVLKEKEEMIESLRRQIPLIEETKISAEMKCLELEEKLEGYLRNESDGDLVRSELEKAKLRLLEYQDTISELNMKLQSRESLVEDTVTLKALQEQSSSLAEWQSRYAQLEDQLSSTLHHCQQLTEEKKQVELENERLLQECAELRGTVENLNGILNMKTESPDQEVVLLRQTLAQKEVEVSNVNLHNKGLTMEVDNLRHALESTTAELHSLYQQLEDLSQTRHKVEELSANLDNKHKELELTTSELDKRSRKLSEYKKFHKLKSEDVLRISHELETVTASFQQRISELETALNKAQKAEEDLRQEMAGLKADTSTGSKSVDEKLQEQSIKIKKLAANLKLKTKLIKDLEAQKQELECHLQEKEAQVNSLRNENDGLIKQLGEKNLLGGEFTPNNNELEEKCKTLELEVNTLKEELKLKTEELQCLQNSSSENYETHVQIKELENQNQKLSDISETKSDQLRKMEDEIADLNGLNKSLMSELELMQESYKQDALKNESVLDVFESEMLGSKKDILELSNQLKDVTGKYEQAWAKLQEKDGYIEDLEQQLEKTKSRLLQIETTVEERRRSLELKAEMLGAHLCQTEKDKEQLEKYEGELEQKVADLVNREEMLGNIVEKLQEENCELLKSLNEFSAKNTQVNEELISEHEKAQKLTKEIVNLQTSLTNYETIAEENEKIKREFKEFQEFRDNRVLYLERRLVEAEQCMESETQRLLDKISLIETERHQVVEKLNSLVLEKQMLEEELSNTQQIISDAAKEEVEQLKINHENLTRELGKELEKRQDLINRIQFLESQVSKQSTEFSTLEFTQELNELKIQLDREIKEKEELKYELIREKARRQVNDVVSKAEETYFTMTSPSNEEAEKFSVIASLESGKRDDEINELQNQLSNLHSENSSLRLRLQELEPQAQSLQENLPGTVEGEDWAAVSKDEDDGWGWGSKDAMLEHEYIQKQKVNSDLETKVTELQKNVRSFEEENQRLAEELKAAQTKCNKLMRKVKEFKNKSDSLERSSRERSVGFDDLDLAMQEELKSQIEKLEKNLKECTGNLNILQVEREGFLKRIDTLTSGNERLIEMKERQDIEVEMWQRRSNELQNKVQGLEWTIAELHAEQSESKEQNNSSIAPEEKQHFLSNALEMEEKLNALAAENDYLQSLLVELKDKEKKIPPSSSAIPKTETNVDINQQRFNHDEFLHLKQENDRLMSVILNLEGKLKLENTNTNDDVIEYSNRIESLMKENEWLTSTLAKLKTKTDLDFSSKDNYEVLNESYKTLKSENEYLTATITELNEKMAELNSAFDKVQTERNNYRVMIQQLEKGNEESPQANVLLVKDKANDISPVTDESPVLFRGFTSSDDNLFEVPTENLQKPIVDSKPSSLEVNTFMSATHQVNFFDTIQLKPESTAKCEQEEIQSQHVGQLSSENVNEKSRGEEYLAEINNLKALLIERESELCSLKESLAKFEEENNKLKSQINEQTKDENNALAPWGPLPGMSSDEFANEKSLHWGAELDILNKKLVEKDDTISCLKEKLNSKHSGVIGAEKSSLFDTSPDRNDSFNDLFSRSEDGHESQINYFVEQITDLTKTLHDKEVEIESLSDKKKKYKELYCSLAKEYNINSPDQSNADKEQLVDQNFILNQLLEDKETELEIMSQQIDQSKVAKENLQDELSLKLCEMEAANSSFSIPELPKEILLPPSQPENIEEVKTLCEEIAELTKLLQEKESEVEILKQQLDESNLEKESLIDEWKKEIENYKEKSFRDAAKVEKMEEELETIKDVVVANIEKKYKEEISLKDQQLMNTMNDLHNTRRAYEDIQTKQKYAEETLEICLVQKDQLAKEVYDLKTCLSMQEQTNEFGREISSFDEFQKLKNDFSNLKVIYDQVKSEVEEKDKTIVALQERVKLSESSSGVEGSVEDPVRAVQMKTFASEPFRISTEQSSSDDDSNSRHMEAVQGQIMLLKEVQSLKQVLAMKDAEITRMSIALNEAQESLISSEEESLRHRLDEALYTLHLRDVRCDELALELMQLLEERDSLQLRLSTAIRFTEELRAKSKQLDEAALQLEGEPGSRNSSLTGGDDPDQADNHQLKQKLDQLHNVGYRRDPAMQQDQQRRHHEQMHLYAQHPTQDESQQSSGFFGWLFGSR